jgi:hypothetical protein
MCVNLRVISIFVRDLTPEDIDILGTLPALRYVDLGSMMDDPTQSFVLSSDAFPCLRVCDFGHAILQPHVFTRGAMPMVQKLSVGLRVSDILSGDLDLSIWNLPSLQEVTITLYKEESTMDRLFEARSAIRRTAHDHPNHPLRLHVF